MNKKDHFSNGSYSMSNPKTQTPQDIEYNNRMDAYFEGSIGTSMEKLRNFTKYVPRQTLSVFLAKQELFKQVLSIHGHIIECGVFLGGGLLTWAQFSAIYEPYNHTRKVVGFDTFTGFLDVHSKDKENALSYISKGGLAANSYEDIKKGIELFDINRPLGHMPKVDLVLGDAIATIPKYLEENQHLVVSLLYLDFDLYEPTKIAIEMFLPRMPKGAILAFDELNQSYWPGETMAVLETVGLRNLKICRFPITPQLSYAVL